MATITKREIAERIAKQTEQTQVVTKDIIQRFLDEIVRELATGNKLEFRDFGIFEVVQRRSRNGRNPRTGAKVFVPAKRVVSFKMGRRMKKTVAAGTPDAAGQPEATAADPPPASPPPAPIASAQSTQAAGAAGPPPAPSVPDRPENDSAN